MTISSPEGSSSISTSRNSTPRSFKKDFARRQAGHQVVLYMVIGSILCSVSLDAGRAAKSHQPLCEQRQRIPQGTSNQGAAPLGGDLDADQSALQRDVCAVPIDVGIVRGQALLGTSQRIFGALQIDLFGALGGFCKDRHAIRKNFGKSANNGEMRGLPATGIMIAEFADPQLGDQRRVPWEYSKIAVLPRQLHFDGFLAEQLALRRDDDKRNGIRQHFRDQALAFIFSALASASSIVPTM